MWFNQIAMAERPGRDELRMFVKNVRDFLDHVLEDKRNFGFLWESSPNLYNLAVETFRYDVVDGAGTELDRAIYEISPKALYTHGLEGRPLKFKFLVLNTIGNQWERVKGQLSVREWFKKITEAIDAILDSLIHAAGGGWRVN